MTPLPCPFCGGENIAIEPNGIGDYFAICGTDDQDGCGVRTSDVRCEGRKLAEDRWNARATSGVSLIAAERQRQITVRGWTPEHDDTHTTGDLTDAALCYAAVASAEVRGSCAEEWPVDMFDGLSDSLITWPFEDEHWKPSDDPIRNLVKAGALIAAEIDRLQRMAANRKETP